MFNLNRELSQYIPIPPIVEIIESYGLVQERFNLYFEYVSLTIGQYEKNEDATPLLKRKFTQISTASQHLNSFIIFLQDCFFTTNQDRIQEILSTLFNYKAEFSNSLPSVSLAEVRSIKEIDVLIKVTNKIELLNAEKVGALFDLIPCVREDDDSKQKIIKRQLFLLRTIAHKKNDTFFCSDTVFSYIHVVEKLIEICRNISRTQSIESSLDLIRELLNKDINYLLLIPKIISANSFDLILKVIVEIIEADLGEKATPCIRGVMLLNCAVLYRNVFRLTLTDLWEGRSKLKEEEFRKKISVNVQADGFGLSLRDQLIRNCVNAHSDLIVRMDENREVHYYSKSQKEKNKYLREIHYLKDGADSHKAWAIVRLFGMVSKEDIAVLLHSGLLLRLDNFDSYLEEDGDVTEYLKNVSLYLKYVEVSKKDAKSLKDSLEKITFKKSSPSKEYQELKDNHEVQRLIKEIVPVLNSVIK